KTVKDQSAASSREGGMYPDSSSLGPTESNGIASNICAQGSRAVNSRDLQHLSPHEQLLRICRSQLTEGL
ncbi:hypothetical protein, partial [Williamsia limnetica]|uniref:hypothetical protein n=1 Tax=Williamsia limnetica TaxID=882452 RepID=UPI001B86313C